MPLLSLSTNSFHDLDKNFFVAVSVSCTDTGVEKMVCDVGFDVHSPGKYRLCVMIGCKDTDNQVVINFL